MLPRPALFADPKEVRAEGDHSALVVLLEQLRSILGCFGDERIEVLLVEVPARDQSPRQPSDASVLCFGVGQLVLVQDGGLAYELVGDGLEVAGVGRHGPLEQEAKRELGGARRAERAHNLVHELEHLARAVLERAKWRGGVGLGGHFLGGHFLGGHFLGGHFVGPDPAGERQGREDQRSERVLDSFDAPLTEVPPQEQEAREVGVRVGAWEQVHKARHNALLLLERNTACV
mmetsp:Transcript_30636/g.68710  ORF Transcript_30636/g.68710 Transcript_30636/m.68710 type:complete len:232 (+) Transcript_30636:677-1372(+)